MTTILSAPVNWILRSMYGLSNKLLSSHGISLLSCIATLATVILLREQIIQQKEFLDVTQRAQLLIIIRDPCQSDPQKLAALDALITIDRDYKKSPDLRWAQLGELDLSGMDLTKVNLRFSNLQGAKLVDVNLADADLSDSDLSGTNLLGANINGVILKNTKYIVGYTIFPRGFDGSPEMKKASDEPHQKKECKK